MALLLAAGGQGRGARPLGAVPRGGGPPRGGGGGGGVLVRGGVGGGGGGRWGRGGPAHGSLLCPWACPLSGGGSFFGPHSACRSATWWPRSSNRRADCARQACVCGCLAAVTAAPASAVASAAARGVASAFSTAWRTAWCTSR